MRLEEAKIDTHDLDYYYSTSSSSCYVKDIKGIIYGGLQSRFWMLRKHFNSMNLEELDDIPFHSWQCLTLILPHRDVDIVIKDPYQMKMFLKFLIYSMKTINGTKNSAVPVINALIKQ